jgi:uncharacterized LabA/DUF88 family protein
MRVACYIDGFNLYHAIDGLDEPALKWADLRSLASSYLRKDEELVRTVFFTALNTWDAPKRARHVQYINALEFTGVEVKRSNFDRVPKWCHANSQWCKIREEKQTDVSIAVEMLADCYRLGIERILLISADSDQIPAVATIRSEFPNVIVYLIAPPKRLNVARELGGICSGVTELSAGRLRKHSLPHTIRNARGKQIAARPSLYGDRFKG